MKLIKLFENFQSDQEIIDICRKYDIQNYTINADKSIDVYGDVYLSDIGFTKLPLNFNHVSGNFDCSFNKLTALEGSPKSVGGYFDCRGNKLTSLEGSPQLVSGDFDCYNNLLTSLEGAPQSVNGNFDCSSNQLTNLEGAPQSVSGNFYCYINQLTTLEGAPQSVGRRFHCYNNLLTTLEGVPQSVGTEFLCNNNLIYHVWKLISPDNKWNNGNMDLFNDYDIFRGEKDIIKSRLNSFLEEIGRPTIDKIDYYKLI